VRPREARLSQEHVDTQAAEAGGRIVEGNPLLVFFSRLFTLFLQIFIFYKNGKTTDAPSRANGNFYNDERQKV
jgi:hypothetical protein